VYRERYLGPSLIMSSAERRLKSRVSTAPRDFPCPFGFLMPVGAIGRSFTARARWGREHAYGNPPGGLSFLPRLAAAFITNCRSNSRSSLRWEKTWDQILGNGVVDHGIASSSLCHPRSHPLAAARTGSVRGRYSAAWISNYHGRALRGLWIGGKGVPIRGKRQGIETRIAGLFAAGIVLLAPTEVLPQSRRCRCT